MKAEPPGRLGSAFEALAMTLAAPLPTGAVTFAFTDIESSTVRWERDRAAMHEAVRRHDAIMRAVITEHGGHVFKTIGDAFCAAFTHPEDAVAAMLATQRALAAEDFSGIDGLRVRAALCTGTADERNSDYFGPTVNRVARLMAAAAGGQVLVSHSRAELLESSGIILRDLGEHRLKGLDDAEHIFQLLADDLPSDFPPLRSMDGEDIYRTPGFTGRDEELAAVAVALGSNDAIAAVHGLGGTGDYPAGGAHSRRYAVAGSGPGVTVSVSPH